MHLGGDDIASLVEMMDIYRTELQSCLKQSYNKYFGSPFRTHKNGNAYTPRYVISFLL